MERSAAPPRVSRIGEQIWLMHDDSNSTWYLIAGEERAMVVDTSIGQYNVREVARELTGLPLICVNTHGHRDHMGGNWSFDGAYMNLADLPLARRAMEGDPRPYPPFAHIEDGQVFDLGGVALEAVYLPGHTPGEIVLLDRRDRALFSGDGIVEHLWLQMDESPGAQTQLESLRRLEKLRGLFDTILTGHCTEPAGLELLDTMTAALEEVVAGKRDGDIDYRWRDRVSRAHPYQPNDRRIVYK